MFKQFGGKLTPELIKRYEQSPNWYDGCFQNLEETTMDISASEMPGMLYKMFFGKGNVTPEKNLPVEAFDKATFLAPDDSLKYIWYGHGVYLVRLAGKTILIDPMLGQDSAPIAPTKTRRFSKNTLDLIQDFPEIDLLLLTHDHYDHLDYASMKKLFPKIKNYFVALGSGRHLESWGVSASKITEFDWWDTHTFEGIELTFTPSRHFSGRGLRDRAKSLWGGWVLKSEAVSLYHTGDGGYGAHFKEVGAKLGPFDFGFVECGQYNERWHSIHMFPEEAVTAAQDAGINRATPYHWGGFKLAFHPWKEPAERFIKAASAQKLNYTLPRLGQLMHLDQAAQIENWWEAFK
ncbi:MBL fold metallo-hydrolase [Leeuwenhoekiella marinoflava]|uniref:L-ascorbate metabolism protein UlaG (Beta-lactamase superfamily) n=2 Tax=Leeuwenhoekiella marinoflava TaxID=988 RepID=A0A4Q0PQK2_9FLAO|nr:MBL fold metallo-hydrolase [Leeuwenhoekiella marinoflava]RXG32135.1 L-ascorbate metabolism protein UlaG (beta-lactamase superfamily) [Leeuwenhoekiella marinoflava]SHE85967.1 L-ascorbate metabolism protein UlaG, beta-lactamase superfamily [Leeuwenhoekiella marinoflava DSM 3653]